MAANAITVSQLNEYVQSIIKSNPLLKNIRVNGEISGFKKHSSGHMYFSLKDETAVVRCVMFRSHAMELDFLPYDGMEVILSAEASLYVRDGQFQLYVTSVEKNGEGELYKRFLQLKSKLEQEGLFKQENKKQIPYLPKSVGIITSKTGAVLQDIIQVIRRRYPKMDIVYYPVAVQGEGAADEIAQAIYAMNKNSNASVLIVGRGGGSVEDLWAFNEEVVARAIFDSKIPIVSAVGHETDITIADFVADLRAPTPSAAAELCVPEYYDLAQYLDSLVIKLPQLLNKSVAIKKEKVKYLINSKGFFITGQRIKVFTDDIMRIVADIDKNVKDSIASYKTSVASLLARLELLSPKNMLDRGFVALCDNNNDIIIDAKALKPGDDVKINMRDGVVHASVSNIELAGTK